MSKCVTNITALAVGVGVAFGFVSHAAAQDAGANSADAFRRDRNTSVTERRKEREDEGGWLVGGFRVKPQLDVSVGYTDNYAAAETDPESSTVYNATARLDLESTWRQHELNASLQIPSTTYEGNFTATDFVFGLDGRVDVDRSMSVDVGAGYADRTEPLGFSDTGVTFDEPLAYDEARGFFGVTKAFGRLRIAGRVDYSATDYDEGELSGGGLISFDERDLTTTTYGLRADLAISEATSIFVSASANERDYDLDPPDVAINQDSQGQEYLVGVNFDITRVMRGEVAAGSFTQSYDEPGVDDETGWAARGQVEWFPDELVTVTLGAERSIQSARSVDAATLVASDVNFSVDYEFRRNVNFGAAVGYSQEEYTDIDRDDTRWSAFISGEYEATRALSLTFSAGHVSQVSDGVDQGRNYDANVALIGVRLRR
jgi:hypothetical protein